MTQKKKELPYLERDISWMYFNRRILQEAARPHVPLLERMAFLGIYSNNLDEFFRVRMATQNRIAECTDKSTSRESEHAKKLIKQISKQNTEYTKIFEETIRQTTEDLKKENIYLISDTEVSSEQLDFIRSYYKEKLSGSIIPIWFSAIRYFDFENDENIYLAVKVSRQWSKKMQDAGVNVIFGVEGLKVHSKITHIKMKKGPDIACISTGNFHEGNARMYTDCMLMTAAPRIVKDVHSVFDFIERPYNPVKFKELLVSPNEMRNKFIALINNEIKNKKAGKDAYIKIKINHITDPFMVNKLYEASQAGVDIQLVVRGNCSLITGIEGVSENIRINGIIDRYLEHSRIFVFASGGEEKVFIGSADWMPRNLNNRIEVITPVYDPVIKKEMKHIVEDGFKDTMQGRIVDGSGKNLFREEETPFRSQEALYNHYLNENI